MNAAADPAHALHEVRLATPARPDGWPLHMPEGVTAEAAQRLVAAQALRWTYVLRSRRRWVEGSRARERNEQEARAALAAIGVHEAALRDLGAAARIVVRIPYRAEEALWEARIFPWEYVLAAATREQRLQRGGGSRPCPLTVMREIVRMQAAAPAPPDTSALRAGGVRLLFVECLPAELREHWSLQAEKARIQATLPAGSQWRVLGDPTLPALVEELRAWRPQLVHFGGLDNHQGLRELRLHFGADAQVDDAGDGATAAPVLVDELLASDQLIVDGVMLRGPSGLPQPVHFQHLARAMAGSGHQPYLVTLNLWNTAARVAPLLVAEGGALAALGFQDAFDDSLAEFVHAALYERLLAGGWNLPQAFEQTWALVRELPESVDATGITLWAAAPLLPPAGVAAPAPGVAAVAAVPAAPRIDVDVRPHPELNYAVVHNAQPLFQAFVLECDRPGEDVQVDVEVAVHMGSEVARFARRVTMRHRRVALTGEVHVPLTAEVARRVGEAISSSLAVEVRHGARVLYRDTHRLRLLPVDQWRDNRRDGRWLPSFVQPRDPAVVRAIAQAQRYNRVLRDDPDAGFEGYQLARPGDEDSLQAVDRQVEAIWATLLHDWRLGYINPPPTYSGTLDSQRLRMPSMVLEHQAGTCIDLALLFAACLELVDIHPVVFLLEGHALPGWWRHPSFREEYFRMPPDGYAELVEATATVNTVANAQAVAWHAGKASWPEVRRWIRERKLVPIETVRLTENCGFAEAIEAGVAALAERRDFDSMLEIVTARMRQVTPLPMLREAS